LNLLHACLRLILTLLPRGQIQTTCHFSASSFSLFAQLSCPGAVPCLPRCPELGLGSSLAAATVSRASKQVKVIALVNSCCIVHPFYFFGSNLCYSLDVAESHCWWTSLGGLPLIYQLYLRIDFSFSAHCTFQGPISIGRNGSGRGLIFPAATAIVNSIFGELHVDFLHLNHWPCTNRILDVQLCSFMW